MKRVLVRAVAATTLSAAAVGGMSVAAYGATDSVQACQMYVAAPESDSATVWVRAGRRGCSNTVTLTLELKKTGWGVGGVVDSVTRTGVNFELTASGRCAESGHGEYYGRAK